MPPIAHLHPPDVTFRLSQLQWQVIRPGFVRILIATRRQMEGVSPSPHVPLIFPQPRHGMFWPFFADIVSNLWLRSYEFFEKAGRCRFRANFLEIAILELAAKAEGDFVPDSARYIQTKRSQAVRVRLLRRLKKIHRRAVIKAKEQLGHEPFYEFIQRWKLFAGWLKFWALKQRYTNPVQQFSRARCRRLTASVLHVAQDELKARNIDVPPESELRPLVRRAIRECRRHRTGLGIITLIDEPIGHDFLFTFIKKRLPATSSSSRRSRSSAASPRRSKSHYLKGLV